MRATKCQSLQPGGAQNCYIFCLLKWQVNNACNNSCEDDAIDSNA
jgi:hypothetical protein